MADDLLQQLRDIHLPPEPSWWPPAPGWWLLLLTALAFTGWLALLARRRVRRRRPVREARQLYGLAHQRLQNGELPPRDYLNETNEILKRLLIHGLGRQEARAASAADWLALLDEELGAPEFSTGPGQVLGEGRFRPLLNADVHALHEPVSRLLDRALLARGLQPGRLARGAARVPR